MLCKTVVQAVLSLVVIFAVGCSEGGGTAPARGTLKIDGQPANNVTISLVPSDSGKETASGSVKDGNFELFTGVQGARGAMPGKYKVVLAQSAATSMKDAEATYKGGSGGPKGSNAPKIEATFPEKYNNAKSSDKEVEIKSGDNNLTIEITSK